MKPTRATYRDVSLKVFKANPIQQWKNCCDDCAAANPVSHTCTGIERDARESFELGKAFPEAIIYIQDHQPGGGTDEYAIGQLSTMLRLATIYEAKSLAMGLWNVGVKGRYYQKDQHIVSILQGGIRAAGCVDCPQGLLDMVDLDENCKPGARGFVAPPDAPYDNGAGFVGMIKTHVHLDKLTPAQEFLLYAVEKAHHSHGDPIGAHYTFEESAKDVQQSAFFKMRDFIGHMNKAWTKGEADAIDELRDVKHAAWTTAIKALDWEKARIAANDHLQAHLIGNLGKTSSTMLYRFSRPNLLHNAWPALSWKEVLADKTLLP